MKNVIKIFTSICKKLERLSQASISILFYYVWKGLPRKNGATTFSITALSITTLTITTLSIMTLSITTLSIMTLDPLCRMPFMLSVANMYIMLSAVMLSVIMLSVIMLSIVMLSVVMLNVVAPDKHSSLLWIFVKIKLWYYFITLGQGLRFEDKARCWRNVKKISQLFSFFSLWERLQVMPQDCQLQVLELYLRQFCANKLDSLSVNKTAQS